MRINIFCWVMIVLFVLPASSVAEKITAKKVIENIITNYEKSIKDVKDITIVTDKGISYQKWITIKGKTICKTRNEGEITGKKFIGIYDGVYQWRKDPVSGKVTKEKLNYNPYQVLYYQAIENLKTTLAQYKGTEGINGHKTHILEIKDMTKLIPVEMEGWKDVTASGKLWIDTGDWVLRKAQMDIEGVDEEGKKRTVKNTIEQKDFRKVNGLLIPYRTVFTTGIPLTPEEKQKMLKQEQEIREGLAEMQKQLDEMPPGQRKMAEKFMKPQIEKMQKALRSGEITEVTEVKDVKVNTGLSDDLFDGSKLKQ